MILLIKMLLDSLAGFLVLGHIYQFIRFEETLRTMKNKIWTKKQYSTNFEVKNINNQNVNLPETLSP